MCPSPLPMATLGEDAHLPDAVPWGPWLVPTWGTPVTARSWAGSANAQAPSFARWRGRACSGTPAAAPRAGRRVFRWLLPGQGPRARRPARVGGAPSATLGVGVPRHRGPLRRGGRRNPITAPRAGRASQGCSAGAGTAGLRAPLPPRPPSGRLPEAAAGQHGPPGAQRPPRGARPDSPRRGLRCGGRGTRRRRGSPERRLRRALPSPSVDTTRSARPLARRRGEERDEREPGAGAAKEARAGAGAAAAEATAAEQAANRRERAHG